MSAIYSLPGKLLPAVTMGDEDAQKSLHAKIFGDEDEDEDDEYVPPEPEKSRKRIQKQTPEKSKRSGGQPQMEMLTNAERPNKSRKRAEKKKKKREEAADSSRCVSCMDRLSRLKTHASNRCMHKCVSVPPAPRSCSKPPVIRRAQCVSRTCR